MHGAPLSGEPSEAIGVSLFARLSAVARPHGGGCLSFDCGTEAAPQRSQPGQRNNVMMSHRTGVALETGLALVLSSYGLLDSHLL